MVGIKYYKNLWIPCVVHTAIIQVHQTSIFGRRPYKFGVSCNIFAHENSSQKHCFESWFPLMRLQGSLTLLISTAVTAGVQRITSKVRPCIKNQYILQFSANSYNSEFIKICNFTS